MKIEIRNRCSDFNSYRAARVKSLFNPRLLHRACARSRRNDYGDREDGLKAHQLGHLDVMRDEMNVLFGDLHYYQNNK